ncbi:hypothetical protein Pst134EA_007107 [Puccinia striiformis f. sp. tritici]|nr:hypothetical protein Pst134EA_007107 [Puccinia striiformis f. sp. tritici]KAH9469830.1 hypothetical protein Pst134EA_007107 [Puccinia striiformis f. sp. tritici]KAI9608575.1 hypothetical protein H4Q26_004758 [Puccinia striiformis f. sp. tritici PST-130]
MADSETDSSTPTTSVLRLLLELEEKFEQTDIREASEVKEELTQDDLKEKGALLVRLESSLLPSIRDQLSCYFTSLDVNEDSREPNPNFKLTCEILSSLEKTWDETRECIESAALDLVPIGTHDHHLKKLKDFRCARLVCGILSLMFDLRLLFSMSISFFRAWQDLSQDSESTKCQYEMSAWNKHVRWSGTRCNKSIGETLKLFQGSDFDIIQDEWQRKEASLNFTIEVLTSLTTIVPRRNTSALRRNVIKLAHLTMPLIKLARMFSNDFSRRTRKKLPFTLETQLNSETLTQLHESAEWVTVSFEVLARELVDNFNNDSPTNDGTLIPHQVQRISQALDSTLVILAMYLIPLPGPTTHLPPGNHYKARFAALQERWHCAINNFLTALPDLEGQHQHHQPALEE